MSNPAAAAMYAAQFGAADPQAAAAALAAQQQALQQQHALQQHLRNFWLGQAAEMEGTTDFKNHNLPLARIKKIMKSDEDVRMISSEAPALFAKACEMFILEARALAPAARLGCIALPRLAAARTAPPGSAVGRVRRANPISGLAAFGGAARRTPLGAPAACAPRG